MKHFGEIIEAKVYNENEKNYFVQFEGMSYTVPKDSIEDTLDMDEVVEGLVYLDKSDESILQIDMPDIRPGIYGWGKVTAVKDDLGIFVDVGLINKDVVVSLDDLPEDHSLWPRRDDKIYLTYSSDDKNRFWGHIARIEDMESLFRKAHSKLMNQDLVAICYRVLNEGVLAISQEGYDVYIHESELLTSPRIGLELAVRVIDVHADGRLNGSNKPRSYEALDDDAEMIYAVLTRTAEGYLPYHDKSNPEDIKKYFGLSKSQFKKAVGRLMKNDRIKQVKDDGIYLVNK